MLRFFRNIRQRLIEQENVRKYIWYALGEILLVMIGILLALQVNNWNEQRKLKDEEDRVLLSLRTEITESIEHLENRLEREGSAAETIKTILIGGEAYDSLLAHPKVDSLMWNPIWMTVSEVPVLQTYSDLKSSGNISIIQNYQIREGLSELQFGLNNLDRQQKDLLTVQQLRIDEMAIEKMDFITMLRAQRYNELPRGSGNNYRELFNDELIRNTLGAKLSLMSNALDIRVDIINACKRLLELIEAEIEK